MATIPGGQKILIVDDDVHVAETLELIFLAKGYKVRAVHSAEEAIELLAQWEPALAIVDVMLPCMNGIEFGEALRLNYPKCRLILMSGHPGTEELLRMSRKNGEPATEVLAKPLHPIYILEMVAGLLPGAAGEA